MDMLTPEMMIALGITPMTNDNTTKEKVLTMIQSIDNVDTAEIKGHTIQFKLRSGTKGSCVIRDHEYVEIMIDYNVEDCEMTIDDIQAVLKDY